MNCFFRNQHEALHKATKPYQYVGGEFLSYNKDFDSASVKFAFVFPDKYEIGISNLGVRVIYDCVNSHKRIEEKTGQYIYPFLADRAYAPEPDFKPEQTSRLIGRGYEYRTYNIPQYGRIELHDTINTMYYEKDGKKTTLNLDRLYWLTDGNAALYLELIKNPKRTLNKKEEVIVADMMNNGVIEKTSQGYRGTIPVIPFALLDKWCKSWNEKFKDLAIEYYETLYKAQENIMLPYIRHDLLWASFWSIIPLLNDMDSMLMQYAMDNKMVRFAEGLNASCVAMVLLAN